MADTGKVREYWENNPLFSHELALDDLNAYFDRIDNIKRWDVERFAMHYWDFPPMRGKKLLEVGCGPGWLTVQYAGAGALVSAIDLTEKAVQLTLRHAQYKKCNVAAQQADAQNLPFGDNSFDVVVSSGVLHHFPDFQKGFSECFRVLKPGGICKITLYRKGLLHSRLIFPLARMAMRWAGVKHPGADMAATASGVDDFIRQYDGEGNPYGIGKPNKEWAAILKSSGFIITGIENHFFPVRFLPGSRFIPVWLHYLFDRFLGTMVYFNLEKPVR